MLYGLQATENYFNLPRTYDAASLKMGKGGLYIMELSGGFEQMGRQHAELVRGITDDIVVKYYVDFLEKLVKHTPIGAIQWLPPKIANMIYGLFVSMNKKNIGDLLLSHARGFVSQYGMSEKTLYKAVLFADILHFLAGKAMKNMCYMGDGCSCFMVRDKATKDGKMYVGRTFDFYGNGYWDEYQSLIVMKPDRGQKFLWVGTLGLPVGGFGENEAGIGVMMLTKFCTDVSLKGQLLFSMLMQTLSQAESLDDVKKLIEAKKRIGALTLFVYDKNRRDATAFAFSANRLEVNRPENDILVHTNHFITDKMKQIEVAPTPWSRHSNARYNRLESLFKANYGNVTIEDAVAAMADTFDYNEGRRRIVGDIVGAINNAHVAIAAPDDGAIYVARDKYPVCHSEKYYGYNVKALLTGKGNIEMPDVENPNKLTDREKLAITLFNDAWGESLDRYNDDGAIYNLRRAAGVMPQEPIYHRLIAHLLLKKKNYTDALSAFEKNQELTLRHCKEKHARAESILWVGRCQDLLGNREKAIEQYKKVAAEGDAEVTSGANKNIKKPFRASEVSMVEVEFIVGGPIAKY